ncbi:amidohydrolase family protein [Asanoa siamensis]|uniref:Amidohydrolase n=1 Tax=Asanoa siamensis TaxID=926357 RepID=A0ABQ4D308_9ACTN|nr:amidohydrolase family protein [Asanoa siamensis]GIF77678.1 amidohydrolase [Asanoa siamensis]
MMVIDAHLHVWDPRRRNYPWLDAVPALRRPFLLTDLVTNRIRPRGAVLVEAGAAPEAALDEAVWVESLRSPMSFLAIVAQAPVELGRAAAAPLATLADRPRVSGVRRNLQDEDPGFALTESFRTGVGLLAAHDLTFDLCVRHEQLPEVTELVRRTPEVTFVLDHLGKPPVRDRRRDPWRAHLQGLAALPNVRCKLSGLTTEAAPRRWRPADVLPYLDHALQSFGPARCMFGSDWPVATLATSYDRWIAVVDRAVSGYTEEERHRVMAATAIETYRLTL